MNDQAHKNISSALSNIKIVGSSLDNISTINHNNTLTRNIQDKSNSRTSPYHINSRIENSERVDSEWELGLSQGGGEWSENLSRENRFLKKKKEKMKTNREKNMLVQKVKK